MNKDSFVSASEVGEYVYCKRAWWLNFSGLVEKNSLMIRGAQAHEQLAFHHSLYKKYGKILFGLLILCIVIACIIFSIIFF